jgi:ubiquitin-protein ligase
MSPRERRLRADRRDLDELAVKAGVRYSCEGDPPDRYLIAFEADGLAPGVGGRPELQREHRVACYLHLDYPRHAPLLVWQTPIFHPNILGPERHGAVCLGSWSPSESLADLCRRLIELAAWRSFSVADALDPAAAEWATQHEIEPGRDVAEALTHA